jgi:putative transposase
MLNAILVAVRFVILAFSGHKQVALENAALRQQLAVFKRDVKRPKLHGRDRLFWITLRMIWEDWKSALVIVQPETVVSWHRNRFKRYWCQLSRPKMPGRPPVTGEIRKLVRTMALANPLWGALRVHGELLKLGFEISERTVSRLMPKKERKPRCRSQGRPSNINSEISYRTKTRFMRHRGSNNSAFRQDVAAFV